MSPQHAPVRVGLSARLMHMPPLELGFRNKTLQYLEQSIAHWVMSHGAVVFMLPAIGFDAEVSRRQISVRNYVNSLDALMLQGGADVSPTSYGQKPLRPEWSGDIVRDRYEMELLEGFLEQGKPVLGICRGCQLINVAFGGTLLQDIAEMRADAGLHVDADLYDQHQHDIRFEPQSRLAQLYEGREGGRVNSIHHQAVDRLGSDLQIEARSTDDGVVEAIRARGTAFVAGLQWHPEFHAENPDLLSGVPVLDAFLAAATVARDGSSPR